MNNTDFTHHLNHATAKAELAIFSLGQQFGYELQAKQGLLGAALAARKAFLIWQSALDEHGKAAEGISESIPEITNPSDNVIRSLIAAFEKEDLCIVRTLFKEFRLPLPEGVEL